VVNSTWQKRLGMNLLLTSSNSTSLKQERRPENCNGLTVNVLSGVVEAGNVRGSSPMRCHALSYLLHSITNAVYIKRSHLIALALSACSWKRSNKVRPMHYNTSCFLHSLSHAVYI